MSLAFTPPASGAFRTDSGKILKNTTDFASRRLSTEKELEERLLHYLVEAQHVQKVQSSVKYNTATVHTHHAGNNGIWSPGRHMHPGVHSHSYIRGELRLIILQEWRGKHAWKYHHVSHG